MLLFRFSLAAGLIAATVVIQALFMSVGINTFKRIEKRRHGAMPRERAISTVIWILFLLIPIILGVTLWGTFYYVSGALPSFEEAFYFSTVTFTTVGYGDIDGDTLVPPTATTSMMSEGKAKGQGD